MVEDKAVKIDDGVEVNLVTATQIELMPKQGALVMYEDGVTLVLPEPEDGEDHIPQHIMFLIGVYFRSADPAFVELMIRSAIDSLSTASEDLDD